MAMHFWSARQPRTIQAPALTADHVGFPPMAVAILGLALLTIAAMLSGWPSQPSQPSARLERDVSDSLVDDRPNSPTRLVGANMTGWGDLNIGVRSPRPRRCTRQSYGRSGRRTGGDARRVPGKRPTASQCHIDRRLARKTVGKHRTGAICLDAGRPVGWTRLDHSAP